MNAATKQHEAGTSQVAIAPLSLLFKMQAVGPPDYQPRIDYCLWFLQLVAIQPDFVWIILFTYEATSTVARATYDMVIILTQYV